MNLSEKYEFRSIRKDEADQATEIEQICFPPAETISRKDIIDRVEKIPELFLVALKTGKQGSWQDILQVLQRMKKFFRISFLQMQT